MPDTFPRGRTLRQRTTGNPLDPNDGTASLVKPAELVDVVELTPLTLVDRRTYNLLIAHAWDRIDEDVEHSIPKAVLRGTHKGDERLSDTIQRLMAGQGAGNQSFQKFIQGPSAVPKRQFSPSRLSETVT
jgi:hypothetical protein